MFLYQIVVLSLIQGLTEFLPVSSSGHLVLVPYLLGWKDQGLLMDVAMHVGTLLAVLTYFHKDVWEMIQGSLSLLKGQMTPGGRLFLMLCLATIPVVIVGFSLRYWGFETRSPRLIAYGTLLFALVLFVADRRGSLEKTFSQVTFSHALVFGCFQTLSLFSGVSRSGICLTAGRLMGFKRPEASRFAFLMSIPTILAAATHTGVEAWKTDLAFHPQEILWSILFSAFFGFLAISFMMYWLKKSTLTLFVIYRLLLGIVLLLWFV